MNIGARPWIFIFVNILKSISKGVFDNGVLYELDIGVVELRTQFVGLVDGLLSRLLRNAVVQTLLLLYSKYTLSTTGL